MLGLLFLTFAAAGCSAPAVPDAHLKDVDSILEETDARLVASGARVRLTGIVTDDDVEQHLAFIAGRARGIAVHMTEITVEVPATADPFQLPVTATDRLLSFDSMRRSDRLARVRGVVLVARDDVVYVRDAAGSVEVHPVQKESLRRGDLVDAVGFASPGSYSGSLDDALMRRVGTGGAPAPVDVQAVDISEIDRVLARIRPTATRSAETWTSGLLNSSQELIIRGC